MWLWKIMKKKSLDKKVAIITLKLFRNNAIFDKKHFRSNHQQHNNLHWSRFVNHLPIYRVLSYFLFLLPKKIRKKNWISFNELMIFQLFSFNKLCHCFFFSFVNIKRYRQTFRSLFFIDQLTFLFVTRNILQIWYYLYLFVDTNVFL